MRIVIALGGNAILQRGQPLEAKMQKENIILAARCIAAVAKSHQVILTHGNGPQVGLLALQNQSYDEVEPYPLDVLDAETEGMIGYLLAQELRNNLPSHEVAALLTQVEVDEKDPAFNNPTKYIGPTYNAEQAQQLADRHHWQFKQDNEYFRRVVPSPMPKSIIEIKVIQQLIAQDNMLVICAGGGGIPVMKSATEKLSGVEAVIDKDWASCCLAEAVQADAFIMLTDIPAVDTHFKQHDSKKIQLANPAQLAQFDFPAGSMGPKIDAACHFAKSTNGYAAIGSLQDAAAIVGGSAGTRIEQSTKSLTFYE